MSSGDKNLRAVTAGPPNPTVRSKRKARTDSRRRFSIIVFVLIGAAGGAWYFSRHNLQFREAKSILTTDPQRAAELLEAVVASKGDDFPDAQVLWSRALLRSNRLDEAIGCLSQIKKPQIADASELLRLADDAQSAHVTLLEVMALEAISKETAERPAAIGRLSALRQRAGDFYGALTLAEELAILQPENAAPWLALAQIHERTMKLPVAATNYVEYLARTNDPAKRANALRPLIRVLIHLREWKDARRYQDELKQNTTAALPNPEDEIQEARIRRLEGNTEGALTLVNGILTHEPNNLAALELRGLLWMETGEYEHAAEDLSAVVARVPLNKDIHYRLAQSLTKLRRTQLAEFHFQENRRLLNLSNRILELQNMQTLDTNHRFELIRLYDQTGMKSMADQLRNRPTK